MSQVTITIHAELEGHEDALQARDDVVESLDLTLPYVFDNVVIESNVEAD